MARRGPKHIKLDVEQITQLAAIGCTVHEIATLIGVSPDTLERNYAADISKGREQGKMSLRRKAFTMSQSGNVPMTIFLLKNLCGMSDKVDYSGEANPHKEDYTRPQSMKAIENL
jgi:hypothetical protein